MCSWATVDSVGMTIIRHSLKAQGSSDWGWPGYCQSEFPWATAAGNLYTHLGGGSDLSPHGVPYLPPPSISQFRFSLLPIMLLSGPASMDVLNVLFTTIFYHTTLFWRKNSFYRERSRINIASVYLPSLLGYQVDIPPPKISGWVWNTPFLL